MLKTILINSAKIIIAGGLIYWLLSSGKLDFKLLAQLKNYPFEVALALLLSIINLALVSVRWRSILKARTEAHLPIIGMLKVSWIGQFFSSVLPGSVSGDLVKILYVQKYDGSFSKKFIFISILIDRMMGLSGLILLVGISSILFSGHIIENAPAMKPLLKFNYGVSAVVISSILSFFFFHHMIRKVLIQLEGMFFKNLWKGLIGLWDDLVHIKLKLIKAVLLSIFLQLNGVIIFWVLIHPFVDGKMDFIHALAFIPIGLMTLALPIAPSGLGVGHAIFQKLFEFSNINNGASLFNLYFFITLIFNVMGVFPYLLNKEKRPS